MFSNGVDDRLIQSEITSGRLQASLTGDCDDCLLEGLQDADVGRPNRDGQSHTEPYTKDGDARSDRPVQKMSTCDEGKEFYHATCHCHPSRQGPLRPASRLCLHRPNDSVRLHLIITQEELSMRAAVTHKLPRGLGERSRDHLTPRQREILRLVAQGLTNREIADALKISVRTVEVHRFNLMRRLRVRNVAQLLRQALLMRLLPKGFR
jgi:DNA-binding CsgD family transcriptional regulator